MKLVFLEWLLEIISRPLAWREWVTHTSALWSLSV